MPVLRPGDDVFGEHDLTVTRALLDEFRVQMLAEMTEHPDLYHPADVAKIRECDELCRRYIRHQKLNVADTLTFAKNSLRWRKTSGINDLKEDSHYMEFYDQGTLVPYNMDKFGSHIMTIRVKLHRKESSVVNEMKMYFAYFVEKMLNEFDALRITVIFDCSDAGISNVDMELIKFIIVMFRDLYPWALGYILVHNMPWILNAIWKIIKSMLPADAVERIRFTTKESILEYVDKQSLPMYMGGEDPYVYKYQKGLPLGERCPKVAYPKVPIP